MFSGLQKIPFFFEYKRRKFLDQWRNIVLHKKIELSGKILQSEAFILDKSLQQVLLKVKEAIEIFNAYDDDRRTQEENIFKENNYRLLEAAKQKVLKEQGFVEANTDSRHLSFTAQAARKSEIARFSRFLKLVELLYPPLSA